MKFTDMKNGYQPRNLEYAGIQNTVGSRFGRPTGTFRLYLPEHFDTDAVIETALGASPHLSNPTTEEVPQELQERYSVNPFQYGKVIKFDATESRDMASPIAENPEYTVVPVVELTFNPISRPWKAVFVGNRGNEVAFSLVHGQTPEVAEYFDEFAVASPVDQMFFVFEGMRTAIEHEAAFTDFITRKTVEAATSL